MSAIEIVKILLPSVAGGLITGYFTMLVQKEQRDLFEKQQKEQRKQFDEGQEAQRRLFDEEHKKKMDLLNEEKKESRKLAINILTRFVWEELHENMERLTKWQNSIQNQLVLKFSEYERVKYDLIKHEVKVIENLFELYYLLSILSKNYMSMKQAEANENIIKIKNQYQKLIKSLNEI